jgi:hypothetical protein
VHDCLDKQIVEPPAVLAVAGDRIDVEERVSFRAADRVTVSARNNKKVCAKRRVLNIDCPRECTRPEAVGPSPVVIPRHTCASAAALRKQMSVSEAAVSATILATSRCSPRSDGSSSRLHMSLIFSFRRPLLRSSDCQLENSR